MPAIHGIHWEVELVRIDIMQGNAARALPRAQERLATVLAWWQQHRSGRRVPESPDPEYLARGVIATLGIVAHAQCALEDWEAAVSAIDAILGVKRALQRPAEDIAATRTDRANVLARLSRFAEAKAELEACLLVFQNNPVRSARVIGSLASLFNDQGDVAQAANQERRALAVREQLPDSRDRATSHNNLASFLDRSGTPTALAESRHHHLAALIYCLVSGLGQLLQTSLQSYASHFQSASAAGVPLTAPRVDELLADPAFHPLADWLRQRQTDVAGLQADVDRLLQQARQAGLGQE